MKVNQELEADRQLAEDEALRAQIGEARAGEQARLATRMRRWTMWLAGVSVLAVLLAVAAWVFAIRSSPDTNKAKQQARLALARQLAAQSLNQLNVNNDLAWLLAIEAGRRAETVDTNRALRRVFAHPGRTLAILSGHTDRVNHAVWNADESRILTASNDGTARVWDAATGTELTILTGHTDWVNQALWNADESRILTSSGDGTARVWDAESGAELATLVGHVDWVWRAVWDSDENRILTASGDGSARVWDAESGNELVTLAGRTKGVWQAVWNGDGTRILTTSPDATARVWDADSGR